MNLKTQEQLVSIINRLNSIAEILYALQMLDNNENEDVSFTDDDLNAMALDYFLNNTENSLARDEYSVGISRDVPEIYQNKNMVVIEIRHINNGNNTLDARYYIDINTAKGFDDSDNPIDLNGD